MPPHVDEKVELTGVLSLLAGTASGVNLAENQFGAFLKN